MSFTYPAFLFALSAIAIPVIIHLFNFRKFKTVYFSNVRFLKEVKQETQAKSKLKHLLILAARILFILFLVLAFAQPYIKVENKKITAGEKAISVFIDNSFSMDAVNKNGTLLDQAKKNALEIVSAYKPSDRFQLFTNNFEGKHQRLVNKEEFIELLDEIKISPATRSLSEISSRAFDVLQQSGSKSKRLFILSDFQKSIADFGNIKNDTSISIDLIPLAAAEKSNVYIDTCWFETPVRQFNQVEKLHVRIKNVSEKELENNSIKLFINNIQKTPASFNAEKNGETEVVLSFASRDPGIQHCRIELNDYPVTFDDKFYFSFEVAKTIPVLCINPAGTATESPFLARLMGSDSLFILKNAAENQLDYSSLSTNRLIILNELKSISSGLAQELKRFMDNGGSVLVFPGENADLQTYREFFLSAHANYFEKSDTIDTRVDKINLDHDLYKDVFEKKSFSSVNLDLPKVSMHYKLSKTTKSSSEELLRLQNGDLFLSADQEGKGKLYTCAAGLNSNFSNFAKHALFVPTIYKIAMYSVGSQVLFQTVGNNESVQTTNTITGESVYHIKSVAGGSFDIIPEHKVNDEGTEIMVHDQITEAGNYDLYADKERIMGISYNFNRKESDLNCFTDNELNDQITKSNFLNFKLLNANDTNLTRTLTQLDQGKRLWKLCLILALIFLAAEVLLLRFMKG